MSKVKAFFWRWLIRLSLFGVFVAGTIGIGGLSEIHGKELPPEYFYGGASNIMLLLNSELFMGFIFMVTLGLAALVLYLLWELHEVPLHKVQRENRIVIDLVFGLAMAGLILNKAWWVLALIVAFTPWRALGDALSGIISRGIHGDATASHNQPAADQERAS